MNTIREIETNAAFEALMAESEQMPILLLKHSTTCPISAKAHFEFKNFIKNNSLQSDENQFAVQPALVRVIESRPTSLHIAEVTGVAHQSPQILLIKNKKVIWQTSHYKITQKAIAEALEHEHVEASKHETV